MFPLASLSLTTPALLGGLALLSIPLAAHLLHRHSSRSIVFPSISLLRQAVAAQSRMYKFRRWILLALRLLAVALIVFAFTRPVWIDARQAELIDSGDHAAVVLILDVSASTGQSTRSVRALERLKSLAGDVLADLEPGRDVAGCVVADSSPESLFPRLSTNFSGLRTDIERLEPQPEPADFGAAFAAAGKLLGPHTGQRRVVVLTDRQKSNWSSVLSRDRLGEALPSGTIITLPELEEVGGPNRSLSQPRYFPSPPLVGEPVELSVRVTNHSRDVQQIRVLCERSADPSRNEILGSHEVTSKFAPGEQREVSFRIASFDHPREFVHFSLADSDALAIDNEAWMVVETRGRTPVVVLGDDDPDEPGTSSYYLMRALSPSHNTEGRFEARHLRTADLSDETLQGVNVLIGGDVALLNEMHAALLTDYVRQGGGLILFSGDGPVSRNLDALNAAGEGQFLPWSPGPRRSTRSGRDPFTIRSGRWQSRWLRAFDEQSQLAISQILFSRVWSAAAVSPEADILLLFDDGTPALGVRGYGQGQVVLAAFSPEGSTSDLARHGAFVAFVQMLAHGAGPQQGLSPDMVAGGALRFPGTYPVEVAEHFIAFDPDGKPTAVSLAAPAGEAEVGVVRASQPGFYTLRDGSRPVGAAAANLDPRESDLTPLTVEEITTSLSRGGRLVETARGGGIAPLRGEPLWGSFFGLALLAIGLELLLLGLWRK